jgi:hypothetical protein
MKLEVHCEPCLYKKEQTNRSFENTIPIRTQHWTSVVQVPVLTKFFNLMDHEYFNVILSWILQITKPTSLKI